MPAWFMGPLITISLLLLWLQDVAFLKDLKKCKGLILKCNRILLTFGFPCGPPGSVRDERTNVVTACDLFPRHDHVRLPPHEEGNIYNIYNIMCL